MAPRGDVDFGDVDFGDATTVEAIVAEAQRSLLHEQSVERAGAWILAAIGELEVRARADDAVDGLVRRRS